MFSRLSLDKNQFTFRKQTGKEDGREGDREELTDIRKQNEQNFREWKRNRKKKIDGKIVWEEKSFNWKGVNFEGIPSRAEPSVTYSQLSRSYFCLTFPICKFRAAFTSNHPAANLSPSIYLFAYSSLSPPSNFTSLFLSHLDQICSFSWPV